MTAPAIWEPKRFDWYEGRLLPVFDDCINRGCKILITADVIRIGWEVKHGENAESVRFFPSIDMLYSKVVLYGMPVIPLVYTSMATWFHQCHVYEDGTAIWERPE